MAFITQALAGIFLFGLCIFFHELGHFLIGKWVGVQPKIFSIGYGRGLFFKRIGRTIYQITAIPLGGYVQFYGDDITKSHAEPKKGDFFSVGPWRRIALALGGPFFSVLLGYLVILGLVVFGWQPTSNEIVLAKRGKATPAMRAGLQTGDRIVAINGEVTDSFEKIFFHVGFAPENQLELTVDRKGKIMHFMVDAEASSPGAPKQIGVHAVGERYVYVNDIHKFSKSPLQKGDKIITVAGERITSVAQLRKSIDPYKGKNVKLTVLRKSGSWFSPGEQNTVTLDAAIHKKEILSLTGVIDLQTGKSVPDIEVAPWLPKGYRNIHIDGKSYSDWSKFSAALSTLRARHGALVPLSIGPVKVKARARIIANGFLGFQPGEFLDAKKAEHPTGFGALLTRTYDQTIFSTKATLVGLFRLIQGKLSFRKSVSGPIKIFAIAYKTVEEGWEKFWFLLANITIILGVMNLLPIPVLDGGHIVFYLIEALWKPLSVKAIALSMRVGMALLLTTGIMVIGFDVWDVFIKGWP